MARPSLRVALLIAYDGTDFAGFQSQANGRAVQDVLETVLADLYGTPLRLRGASRTDAGVHAKGQVASFDLATEALAGRIPIDRLPLALGARLPPDVAVLAARPASDRFDPRRALEKTYRYRLLARAAPCPLRRGQVWHLDRPIDLAAMQEAARDAVGCHDFSAFAAAGTRVQSRVRTVRVLAVQAGADDEVWIDITADGFLYHMARNLVGTLVQIGRRRRSRGEGITALLAGRSRAQAGATAPPQGLCLQEVRYSDDLEEPWLRARPGRLTPGPSGR